MQAQAHSKHVQARTADQAQNGTVQCRNATTVSAACVLACTVQESDKAVRPPNLCARCTLNRDLAIDTMHLQKQLEQTRNKKSKMQKRNATVWSNKPTIKPRGYEWQILPEYSVHGLKKHMGTEHEQKRTWPRLKSTTAGYISSRQQP